MKIKRVKFGRAEVVEWDSSLESQEMFRQQVIEMLADLKRIATEVGLALHMGKTKIFSMFKIDVATMHRALPRLEEDRWRF